MAEGTINLRQAKEVTDLSHATGPSGASTLTAVPGEATLPPAPKPQQQPQPQKPLNAPGPKLSSSPNIQTTQDIARKSALDTSMQPHREPELDRRPKSTSQGEKGPDRDPKKHTPSERNEGERKTPDNRSAPRKQEEQRPATTPKETPLSTTKTSERREKSEISSPPKGEIVKQKADAPIKHEKTGVLPENRRSETVRADAPRTDTMRTEIAPRVAPSQPQSTLPETLRVQATKQDLKLSPDTYQALVERGKVTPPEKIERELQRFGERLSVTPRPPEGATVTPRPPASPAEAYSRKGEGATVTPRPPARDEVGQVARVIIEKESLSSKPARSTSDTSPTLPLTSERTTGRESVKDSFVREQPPVSSATNGSVTPQPSAREELGRVTRVEASTVDPPFRGDPPFKGGVLIHRDASEGDLQLTRHINQHAHLAEQELEREPPAQYITRELTLAEHFEEKYEVPIETPKLVRIDSEPQESHERVAPPALVVAREDRSSHDTVSPLQEGQFETRSLEHTASSFLVEDPLLKQLLAKQVELYVEARAEIAYIALLEELHQEPLLTQLTQQLPAETIAEIRIIISELNTSQIPVVQVAHISDQLRALLSEIATIVQAYAAQGDLTLQQALDLVPIDRIRKLIADALHELKQLEDLDPLHGTQPDANEDGGVSEKSAQEKNPVEHITEEVVKVIKELLQTEELDPELAQAIKQLILKELQIQQGAVELEEEQEEEKEETDRSVYVISGRIQDARTGLALPGVIVYGGLLGTTITDLDGKYSFKNIPAGTGYTIGPEKRGFRFYPPAVSGTLTQSAQHDFAGRA